MICSITKYDATSIKKQQTKPKTALWLTNSEEEPILPLTLLFDRYQELEKKKSSFSDPLVL